MKLERFNKLNENREMYFVGDRAKTEDEQKFEIIEKISQNWSEKLKQDYLVPRSLYKYSLDELKKIEDFYLNENKDKNDMDTTDKISKEDFDKMDKGEQIDYLCKVDPKFKKETEEALDRFWKEQEKKKDIKESQECTICDTVAELKEKYMVNEAVENIRVEEDGDKNVIVFDCKCETDIQGVNEYNGYEVRYNLLCSINESVVEKSEEEMILEARKHKEILINEYLEEIKK
jgi:hypothetical protein